MITPASPGLAPLVREGGTGSILARYRVVETVSRGRYGCLFALADRVSGEKRALKIGHAGIGETMLLDEFAQLARLRHPSLPRVFEVGRTTESLDDVPLGSPFLIAEWIGGGRADAQQWADPQRIWELLADVAGALAVIHGAGLVHGDVAPQNVLLSGNRAVLVDLGLAGEHGARGTPAYMAPEAWAGCVEPRSDLYGLGATVLRLVLGRDPFTAPTLGELAHRIATANAPVVSEHGLGALADVVARLCARDVANRPASAVAVLDELDDIGPAIAPGLVRRARPNVGPPPAPITWPGATAWVAEFVGNLDRRCVHVVVSMPASGAAELVAAATLKWQLDRAARRAAAIPIVAGGLDDVVRRIAASHALPRRDEPVAHWLGRIASAVRTADALVVLELGDDPRGEAVVAALARGEFERPVIAIVDAVPSMHDGVTVHRVPVLDVAGTAALATAMLGNEPSHGWAAALHAASGGRPTTAIELLRSISAEKDPLSIAWETRVTASLVELRRRQLHTVSRPAQRLALAAAVWGGRVRMDRALATARAGVDLAPSSVDPIADASVELSHVVELERAGLARRLGSEFTIDRATADAAEAIAPGHIVTYARAALSAELHTVPNLDALASLLGRVPLDGPFTDMACDVAEVLLARGRSDRARALAEHAVTYVPKRAGMIAASAAALAGRYRDAVGFAQGAERAGADPVEVQLLVARSSQRAGNLDAAEAALELLYAAYPEHPEVAGAYARLLVTRSRYARAREVASSAGPLVGLRAESSGLAAFYLGDVDDADRLFAALEMTATATGDDAAVGRALSLRGMVAQQRGQLGLASDRYREAARRLDAAGEVHAAAVAELNLGTALSERGRASEALPRLAAAGHAFAQCGATTEQAAAHINRGNALLAVGQIDEAGAAVELGLTNASGVPHLCAFALLVRGDVMRRQGKDASAWQVYRDALRIAVQSGDAHVQLNAHVALVELGRPGDGDAAALCASDDDRDRWVIANGRLALLRDDIAGSVDWKALASACADAATRAAHADRMERAFRAHSVAARLAYRGRDTALARREASRSRAAHTSIVAAASPAFHGALAQDPDLLQLPAESERRTAPAADDSAIHLRRLLTLSRRLNSESDVSRILDDVIDTAIEFTAAERGFLLLRQASGELTPVVSRNFAMADLETVDRSLSRSIAERAAQTGEPVITVDAGVDDRFATATSVAALSLRSVLAVPLRQRATITGCIYVDHRLRSGAFDDTAAALLGELADIAAIAIENARLTDALRRTTEHVDDLNRRLAADLADRDAELVRVKADLPDRDRLRHRYDRIVGRSPAIMRMLDMVDRAAVTALPVVVVGESGTGKELVARALHDASPRRDAAFVAVNCSAVPEALLESELFGHVRGAFTGADRDRRGLFEVAHKGTLFLDEVADTGAAMQAKLLRVLQDGVIRRVGETTTRTVDVRVIAASQSPLAELVRAGRFREDLRFRIEVISVAVPALRDRDGDIPLLVDVLLGKFAGAPRRLTRAALRALCQHAWPGNVRELENVLARGVALAGDVIDVGDLPESVVTAAAHPEPSRPRGETELELRPALLATERAYLTAAMTRANNNQTVAARLLGLSRFGLQKKLHRLGRNEESE